MKKTPAVQICWRTHETVSGTGCIKQLLLLQGE